MFVPARTGSVLLPALLSIASSILCCCMPPATAAEMHHDAQPAWLNPVDVPAAMLQPEFWISTASDPQHLLHDAPALAELSRVAIASDPVLYDWRDLPAEIDASALRKLLDETSPLPKKPLYTADGRLLDAAALAALDANLNRAALSKSQPVQLALVVRRTDMRRFASPLSAYDTPDGGDIDRFQETALFPGMTVALLHESADGRWWLAQAPHYIAWLRKDDVAVGTRDQILAYESATPFLVVSGARVQTAFTPEQPALSALTLDMGVRLPLLTGSARPALINGQSSHAGHAVLLPIRRTDGSLKIEPALIARSEDVHTGYLPLNGERIIRQAFKFLGERYGWGHAYNGRDCSGFVGEVYRSMGLLLPRNAGDQARTFSGRVANFSATSTREEKLAALAQGQAGDLLFMPGHVMMLLGHVNGEPWVIHDVASVSWLSDTGLQTHKLNGVSVTPLKPLMLATGASYLDKLTAIRSVYPAAGQQ